MKSFKPRHRHAINPLMKKGGAHVKSKSAKRSAKKVELKKELQGNAGSSFF